MNVVHLKHRFVFLCPLGVPLFSCCVLPAIDHESLLWLELLCKKWRDGAWSQCADSVWSHRWATKNQLALLYLQLWFCVLESSKIPSAHLFSEWVKMLKLAFFVLYSFQYLILLSFCLRQIFSLTFIYYSSSISTYTSLCPLYIFLYLVFLSFFTSF